jgi:hypothetical protein
MTTAEAGFLAGVLKLAALRGWKAYHTHDSRRSAAGFPDLTLVKRGRLIFAELKRDGQRPKPDQDVWLAALSECGGVETYVWRPADLDLIARSLGA